MDILEYWNMTIAEFIKRQEEPYVKPYLKQSLNNSDVSKD